MAVNLQTVEKCIIGTLLSVLRLSKEKRRKGGVYDFCIDGVARRFPEWLGVVLMDYAVLGAITDEESSGKLRSDILVSLVMVVSAPSPSQVSQAELIEALTDIYYNGTAFYTDFRPTEENDHA